MSEKWTIITTITGLLLSLCGVILSSLTLITAKQIIGRMKDKKTIKQYKNYLEVNKKRIEEKDPFIPGDFKDENKRVLLDCLKYVRHKNRKMLEAKCKSISTISESEFGLLLGAFIIELDDEGV